MSSWVHEWLSGWGGAPPPPPVFDPAFYIVLAALDFAAELPARDYQADLAPRDLSIELVA